MSELNSSNLDKVQAKNKGTDAGAASKLSLEAHDAQRAKSPGTGSAAPLTHAPAASTAESHLPGLDFVEGLGNVAGDIVSGAVNEVIHHPVTLLKDAAIGAVVGAATVAAVALLPEGLAGAAIVGGIAAVGGAAFGGYEVMKNGGIANTEKAVVAGATNLVHKAESLGHSVSVEMDEKAHSAADIQKAKAALEGVGAFGAQVTAGTLGGIGGGGIAILAKGAFSAATAAAATSAEAATSVEAATSTTVMAGTPLETAAATPITVGEPLAPIINDATATAAAAPAGVAEIAPAAVAQDSPVAAAAETAETAPLAPSEGTPVAGDSQVAPVADAAENEAALRASVANEFGPLNPDDEAFAMNLAAKAKSAGFASTSYYAATSLTDPAEIDQFAQIYANSSESAVHNMTFVADAGRVADGTESTWKAALAKLGDEKPVPALGAAAKQAALKATVSSEFGVLSPRNQTFAMNLAEKSEEAGFKSPAFYAAKNLTDPAEIDQFVQMYAGSPSGMHNMLFAVNSGRIMDGTEDAWKAALAKFTTNPAS